jgi:hypothetical protein
MHLRSPWHRRLRFADADGLLATQAAEGATGADEWHGDLDRALNQLPALARSVVWLHDVEGYKHAEIARLFGRSVSFSKSQLEGDVILDIDGRVPNGASHAFQILSSYHPGESLKLHLMRQQKRIELPIELPIEVPVEVPVEMPDPGDRPPA